ncbi:TldD/PmbA family protein [Anaplasmataceae bacterium AB001_6]|nr:TldD/PmbA family protein [Anaplasmataceae bacterium AB001_6]
MINGFDYIKDLILKKKKSDVFIEARVAESSSIAVGVRDQVAEEIDKSVEHLIQFRVFGKNKTFTSTCSEISNAESVLDKTIGTLDLLPEDPLIQIPEKSSDFSSVDISSLKTQDDFIPDSVWLMDKVMEAEKEALNYPGVFSTSDFNFSHSKIKTLHFDSNGVDFSMKRTLFNFSAAVKAGTEDSAQEDYDYFSAVNHSQLPDLKNFSKDLAARAVDSLNPKTMSSESCTAIFSHRIAKSFLSKIIGIISSDAVVENKSFINQGDIGKKIFSDKITLLDRPSKIGGLGSSFFDVEMNRTSDKEIINRGVLNILPSDNYFGRKTNSKSTGNARYMAANGAVNIGLFNPELLAGEMTFDQMVSSVDRGVYITQLLGFGFNPVTGDLSQGARGFMIENGNITHPVSGFTIAGNFKTMFNNVELSDYKSQGSEASAPHLMFDSMVVGGL